MKNKDLHNIKSSGYKTPDNYFESFDDRIFDRLQDEKKIEDIEQSGFSIPDQYFEKVESQILEKLDPPKVTPIFTLNTKRTLYYAVGIAASLILMFAIFLNENSNDEISADMVESYLETRDLDSYELAELLNEAELLEEDFSVIETSYNEDLLELYLLDNADIESIIE